MRGPLALLSLLALAHGASAGLRAETAAAVPAGTPSSAPPAPDLPQAGIGGGAAASLRQLSAELFPVPTGFQRNVDFWIDALARHGSDHVVLHDELDLDVIYAVLDFSGLADSDLSDLEKARRRQREVQEADRRYRAALDGLAEGRSPASEEEQRVEALFSAHPGGRQRYREAAVRLRTQTGLRDKFLAAVPRSGLYMSEMERIFASRGLPAELTRMPFVESMFQEGARSKVGAGGIWQFMPTSARPHLALGIEVDERYDPLRATEAAAAVLADNHAALGSWPLAITAYNSGKGGMLRAVRELGTRDPGEILSRYRSRIFGFASRNFYTEFLAAATIYENREHFFPGVEPGPALAFDRFVPERFVAVAELAALAGTSIDDLRPLNPAYNAEIWSGDLYFPGGHTLRVPAGREAAFRAAYEALPATFKSERQAATEYRVRRGDTLSVIAQRFGTSVSALQRANALRSPHAIREGQVLLIGRSAARTSPAPEAAAAPAPATAETECVHVVRSGETLWEIARRYGCGVQSIRDANRLASSRIYPGQKLAIPDAKSC